MRNSIIACCLACLLWQLPAVAAVQAPGSHRTATAGANKPVASQTTKPGTHQPFAAAKRSQPARVAAKAKPATRSPSVGVAPSAVKPTRPSHHDLVIAIDAGHGGKDTGALGPNGSQEKNVVFAIARKLERLIKSQPGMRPVMIRKGDEFIELRDRAEIARAAKADLFISIHADAYDNGNAKGSSVFTLSRSGASSEAARWLADNENAADLVGGVKLKGRSKLLASVLLDLSQNASMEASDRAAVRILQELQKANRLHQRQVQKAGFVVLKSPDVPSLLVETAFISNPDEEKNLLNPKYQDMVARCIFNGVRGYFARSHAGNREPQRTAAITPEPPVRLLAQH